jgi:hypothetical protein
MPWMEPDYKESTLDALRGGSRDTGVGIVPPLCAFSQVRSGRVVLADWGSYCSHMDVDHRAAILSKESSMYMSFID